MVKPLEGVLVVAVEQAVAAPLCTARLAEAGARVIKIERAEGDFARGYDAAAKGEASYFVWLNQGKESIILDFKQPEDAALLERMIARADVFVQNLAPGALDRAGFGSKALRERYSRLITCDVSGYGSEGDAAKMKAYDFLVQAESGLVGISGGPGELGRIGVSICDIGAGMTAHAGILEALLLREKTGKGSGIAVSLFDTAAEWMTVPFVHGVYGAGAPTRMGLRHPSIAPYGAYDTADGKQVMIAVQNEREWARFCDQALGRPALAEDPRFAANTLRCANRAEMDAAIQAAVSEMTAEDFKTRLKDASIAFAGINAVEDLAEHPFLERRPAPTADGETVDLPAPPIRWVGQEIPAGPGSPKLGGSSDALRREFGEG